MPSKRFKQLPEKTKDLTSELIEKLLTIPRGVIVFLNNDIIYHVLTFLGIKRDKNKEIIFSQPFEVQGKPLIDYRIANLDEWLMKTIYETLEKDKTKGNNPVSLRSVHHYFTTFKSAITYIYNKNRRHFDVNPSELYNKSYKI